MDKDQQGNDHYIKLLNNLVKVGKNHLTESTIEQRENNRLQNQKFKEEIKLVNRSYNWVTYTVSSYLIFIAGFLISIFIFKPSILSTPVLITLLTTTTITVLGLPMIILRSLFSVKR